MSVTAQALRAGVSELQYTEAFLKERVNEYPMVDAFERRMGYALDRTRLENAARVLACPVKGNPPNWQHGRVLYAAARKRLERLEWCPPETFRVLDIGTAKGFSALCMLWALLDDKCAGDVISIDVIDPRARVERKTIAEVDGAKDVFETLAPWPEAKAIRFVQSTGIDWLTANPERIAFCFVDGKHSGEVVYQEGWLLAERQQAGDVAIFDDVQLADVAQAVRNLEDRYTFEWMRVLPTRAYAIGVRR